MKTLKKLWSEYRRELIVGIVTTIITSILWNLLTWIIRLSPTVGASFISTFVNFFYSAAANSTNIALTETICIFLMGSLLGIMFGTIMIFQNKSKPRLIPTIADNIIPMNTDAVSNEKNTKKKKRNRLKYSAIFLLIMIIFLYLFIFAFVMIPSSFHKTFNRDLTMIAPYVEEQQLKLLQSEWVTMQSKEDYLAIYEVIDNVKEVNGLVNK